MVTIREETAADHEAIRALVIEAFDRPAEADLIEKLRDEGKIALALVAEEAGEIVGHIVFSDLPITTDKGRIGGVSLAPMAVSPARQGTGIGAKLVEEGLRICADKGYKLCVVLGHEDYYPRFGFSRELAQKLEAPFTGPAFMALELEEGALDDVKSAKLEYAEAFGLERRRHKKTGGA